MLSLYIFRHGETDHNLNGIVQGGGVDTSLNETGRKQARQLYEAYSDVKFSALYCSTLQRSRQSMEPWIQAGYSCTATPALNELSWGIQEGRKPTESGKASYRQVISSWQKGELEAKIEGGESPLEGWARAEKFFSGLYRQHGSTKLLLCSHGRQMRIVLSMLLGYGLTYMELFSSHNTGMSIVHVYKSGRAFAELLNDTTHLN